MRIRSSGRKILTKSNGEFVFNYHLSIELNVNQNKAMKKTPQNWEWDVKTIGLTNGTLKLSI